MGCSRRCCAPQGLGAEGCQNWRGQHRIQAARDPARVIGLEGVRVVGIQCQLGNAQGLACLQLAVARDGQAVGVVVREGGDDGRRLGVQSLLLDLFLAADGLPVHGVVCIGRYAGIVHLVVPARRLPPFAREVHLVAVVDDAGFDLAAIAGLACGAKFFISLKSSHNCVRLAVYTQPQAAQFHALYRLSCFTLMVSTSLVNLCKPSLVEDGF